MGNFLDVFHHHSLDKPFFLVKFQTEKTIDKLPSQKHYGLLD